MKEEIKVSIIVPIYNVSNFVEKCAISLFEQSLDCIQYVFVNDCTQDNSMEVLERVINKYSNRFNQIAIINHEVNKGLAAARNTGLRVAEGKYILHIDSDDFLEKNMIEIMYEKAESENSDIVVCDFLMQWNNKTKYFSQNYSKNGIEYTKMLLQFDVLPNVWNKLIRRSLFVESGITSVEGINTGEDYLLMPKIACYAKVVSKVDFALYHYNQMNQNSYMKSFSTKSIENLMTVLEQLTVFFESRTDYKNHFEKSLLIGKLRIKIQMTQACSIKDRLKVIRLYPETNSIIKSSKLNIQNRITIWLSKLNCFTSLNIFIYIYRNLFYFKQYIFGRN